MDELRRNGATVLAADRSGDPLDSLSIPAKVAWLFGNEGSGVSADLEPLIDGRVAVPIGPDVDSLNVNVAAGIILHHGYQRRSRGEQPVKITTWNVNSIRAREDRVLNWLDQHQPDVLCLQELKCTEEQFPFDGFDAMGYNVVLHGQKSYNGVAIVSLDYPDWVEEAVPWPEDEQSRGIAAEVNGVRVVSLYCPNGREVGHEMYRYKLEWFDRLRAWLDGQDRAGELVLDRRLQHHVRRPRRERSSVLA